MSLSDGSCHQKVTFIGWASSTACDVMETWGSSAWCSDARCSAVGRQVINRRAGPTSAGTDRSAPARWLGAGPPRHKCRASRDGPLPARRCAGAGLVEGNRVGGLGIGIVEIGQLGVQVSVVLQLGVLQLGVVQLGVVQVGVLEGGEVGVLEGGEVGGVG